MKERNVTTTIDADACIGCGVCATKCDFDAIRIKYREDQKEVPTDFEELHKQIQEQTELN